MLKKTFGILVVLLGVGFLSACGDKSSSNNGNSTTCMNNPYDASCNSAYYNNYSAYGYSAYPTTMGQYGGYGYDFAGQGSACGCGVGNRPVYNGSMGMGCVAETALPRWAPVYYWSMSAQQTNVNHQWVNMPQMSNITNTYSNGGGCF